jgi:hypothetical protein
MEYVGRPQWGTNAGCLVLQNKFYAKYDSIHKRRLIMILAPFPIASPEEKSARFQ